MLAPLISHSPVVFWLLPAFGVRGTGYFLATTETIFGSLIFLGYWSPRHAVDFLFEQDLIRKPVSTLGSTQRAGFFGIML
jgi:hypothetical protein